MTISLIVRSIPNSEMGQIMMAVTQFMTAINAVMQRRDFVSPGNEFELVVGAEGTRQTPMGCCVVLKLSMLLLGGEIYSHTVRYHNVCPFDLNHFEMGGSKVTPNQILAGIIEKAQLVNSH